MSLLSTLKQKLGIRTETRADRTDEIDPIHRPSFSIGDSLGDIKVGVMRLKTQLESIEGSMLTKEYFDQSVGARDRSDLIIGKLDEALRVLTESESRKPSIIPSKPSSEPKTPSLQPSLTEEAEDHVRKAIESLRLRQVMTLFTNREIMTPKELAQICGIKNNTATEHLRKLEKLGYVRRASRGFYEKL